MITIIILDDHQLFIDGIVHSFSNDPEIAVTGFALDGSSGLAMIGEKLPDVVLLDIDFSKTRENGVDILKSIRKLPQSPKVVVLTGHCEASLIEQLQREGANGYRLKNIDMGELRQTILDVYSGEMVFKYDSKLANENRNLFFDTPPILSDRAVEIIRLLSQGFIVKEIAHKLGIAETTVNDHLERTKRKLGAKNNAELVYLAGKSGVI
ncbi:MAG: response regulator transcription factor [Prolixibacteraceae bacterium]|nr:response regulator transcription factor [Prolixibacteraceae bacterium]